MAALSPIRPGYTDTEKRLLQAMVDELNSFTSATDWEQQLPFAVSRAFVMERLGNAVLFTIKLYCQSSHQEEVKLLFDFNIQGTGKEKWSSAEGGFFLSHGSAQEIATAIRSFKMDLQPVQKQLANEYHSTFYDS